MGSAIDDFLNDYEKAEQPKPNVPAPKSSPSAADTTQQPSPAASGAMGDFLSDYQVSKNNPPQKSRMLAAQDMLDGKAPTSALNESPLGVLQKAAFGWMGASSDGGLKQQKFLEEKYGKENAQRVNDTDGNSHWVVKDSDDGKWKQIDPSGLNLLHPTSWMSQQNWKNSIGNVSEDIGARPEMATAAARSIQGAVIGQGLIPIPFVGAGIGGILGGMEGGLEGYILKAGLKKSIGMVAPDTFVGDKNLTFSDAAKQAGVSTLMGGFQALAEGILKAPLEVGAKLVGSGIGRLAEGTTTNLAKYEFARSMATLGNTTLDNAMQWINRGKEVFAQVPQAVNDMVDRTFKLDRKAEGIVKDQVGSLVDLRNDMGNQYNALAARARGIKGDPLKPLGDGSTPITDGIKELNQIGYLDKDGNITAGKVEEGAPTASKNNMSLLKNIKGAWDMMTNADQNGEKISYQQMQNSINNIKQHLEFGEDKASKGDLRDIGRKVVDGIESHMQGMLEENAPELAAKRSELQANYGKVRDLLDDVDGKDQGQRITNFIKKIKNSDGTHNSSVLSQIADALGTEDRTPEIRDIDAAKAASTGLGFSKKPPFLTGGKLAAGMARNFGEAITPGMQSAESSISNTLGQNVFPYVALAQKTFNSLSPGAREMFIKSGTAVNNVSTMISGAAAAEPLHVQQLLQNPSSFSGYEAPQQQ